MTDDEKVQRIRERVRSTLFNLQARQPLCAPRTKQELRDSGAIHALAHLLVWIQLGMPDE